MLHESESISQALQWCGARCERMSAGRAECEGEGLGSVVIKGFLAMHDMWRVRFVVLDSPIFWEWRATKVFKYQDLAGGGSDHLPYLVTNAAQERWHFFPYPKLTSDRF